jgi:hypothetical protein
MKKLFAVGIVIAVMIGMTIPVFAGNPHNQNSIVSVIGTATTEGIGSGQLRVTTINASTLPRGGATGTVKVIRYDGANPWVLKVRDLKIVDGWAYLILLGNNPVTLEKKLYFYLVVHDGSSSGSVDGVSYLFFTTGVNDTGVRAWFDASWDTTSYWSPEYPGVPLPTVLSGGYTFTVP